MSLINQVLKDLEKRHASDAGAVPRAVRPLPEQKSRRGLWVGAAVLVLTAAAAGAWWKVRGGDAPIITAEKTPSPPPAVSAVPTTAPPAQKLAAETQTMQAAPSAPGSPAQPGGLPAPTPMTAAATLGLAPSTADANVASKAAASTVIATEGSKSSRDSAASRSKAIGGGASKPPAAVTASAELPPGSASQPITAMTAPQIEPLPVTAAGPATARPAPARSKLRAAPDAAPKSSAPAQSQEYPDAETRGPDSNIEKQVRPQSNRERAEASFRQGMIALDNGNVAEAEAALREALRGDPLADKARQALLGVYIGAGRREEAERVLEDRLQRDQKHFAFAMALARLQLERGGNGEALATLQRSQPYGENSADYQAMLANALSRVGRHKEAAERFDAATRLAPRNPLWQMGLGVELRADNRGGEARAAFQRARDLGGLNAQLTSFLDQQLRELQ